ncbi:TIGR00266 family protein [Longispora sp. NPDC051575]|uniref:TIGR00266 family protein n=1 Tax=Longispora sp. NPDC051575 TaxID=3154943 RepID=UPI00343549C4
MTELHVLPDAGQAGTFSYRIDYRPAFALATLVLGPEQSVKTESGAMVSMSGNVELTSKMEGGLWGAVKRGVGGRSAFVSTYTARGGPGELTLAPATPGDVVPLHVAGDTYNVAASCYLAAEPALGVETGWGGARSFFGSDSAFVLQVSGTGVLLVTAFGALHRRVLAQGERYVVDTGHLVAWHAGMTYTINKATKSVFRSLTSGEGLVATFTGPGTLLMQTRNIEALAGVLRPFFPSGNSGSSD